jgi:lysozyme family protein
MSQARAIAFVLRPENDGQPYHLTPGDEGGPTAFGFDLKSNPDLTDAVLRAMTAATAAQRYAETVWPAVHGDSLPAVLQTPVFNAAVLDGPEHAIVLLQRSLGIPDDGKWGPQTERVVALADSAAEALAFTVEVVLDYAADKDFARFGKDWVGRALRAMVDGS